MNKKVVLFTLALAVLFLVMAVVSRAVTKQGRGKNVSLPQTMPSLPAKAEAKPEARPDKTEPAIVEQEPRLPSGPLAY